MCVWLAVLYVHIRTYVPIPYAYKILRDIYFANALHLTIFMILILHFSAAANLYHKHTNMCFYFRKSPLIRENKISQKFVCIQYIWQCLVYVFSYLPSAHMCFHTVLLFHVHHCSPKFIKPVKVSLEPSSTVEDVIMKTLGEIEIVVSCHSNGIEFLQQFV